MKANQVLVEVSDEERKAQEERIARKKEQERQEQIKIKLAQVSAGNVHNERNQPQSQPQSDSSGLALIGLLGLGFAAYMFIGS